MNHFPFLPAGSSKSSSRNYQQLLVLQNWGSFTLLRGFLSTAMGSTCGHHWWPNDTIVQLYISIYKLFRHWGVGPCLMQSEARHCSLDHWLSAFCWPWSMAAAIQCSVVHNAGWGVVTTRLPFPSRRSTNWPWQSSARREPKLLQCGNPTINSIDPQNHQKSVI